MKTRFVIAIAGMALIIGACTPVFMIGKEGQEKRGSFLGSTSMYEMLCPSGDMAKVLEDTHLSREMKDALYKYNCSAERSGDKVKEIYASMTSEQRKDIKIAFKKNGYAINGGSC